MKKYLGGLATEKTKPFLITLILIDATVIAVHVVTGGLVEAGVIDGRPDLLDLKKDWGLGEMFNYLKWGLLAALTAMLWKRSGAPVFLALAFTFVVLLADDSLQLHERLGSVVSAGWGRMAGLRGQDFGELVVWALLGIPLLVALGYGTWRSSNVHRLHGAVMLGLLGALVGVGVVVDMIGIFVGLRTTDAFSERLVVFALHVVEDGGEMILASVMVALVVAMLASERGGKRRAGSPGDSRSGRSPRSSRRWANPRNAAVRPTPARGSANASDR